MPLWFNRWFLIAFLTVVFIVFYAVAYSVAMGIRDNYYRYAQRAPLQWTGPRKRRSLKGFSLIPLLGFSLLTAWIVTEFFILN